MANKVVVTHCLSYSRISNNNYCVKLYKKKKNVLHNVLCCYDKLQLLSNRVP